MNEKIKVKIYSKDTFYLESFLVRNSIKFEYLNKIDNYHTLNIFKNDYKKIKKEFNKIKIIGYYGKNNIIKFIKKNFIFFISLIWGLFILYVLSTTIFSIEIKTSNEELKDKLFNELYIYKIKKYGRIKSYAEIEDIKKKILKDNKEYLEWLEIKRDGTKYEVLLTERVIKNNIKSDTPRNIVSSKDALIRHIDASNGVILKDVNDYVKKGEVIISGDLYKGDKYIKSIHASGNVYGEVWYTVKTTVPYKYIEYVRNGKVINHYYIELFGIKMTLFGKYETNNSMNTTKVLIDKPYLGLKLVKEKKELYDYKEFIVSKDEAYKEAIKRSDKSILNKLNKDEYIISKKVLNNSLMSSKIELVIFYKVYENITDSITIEEKKEL